MKVKKIVDLSQPFGHGTPLWPYFPGHQDRALPLPRQVGRVHPVAVAPDARQHPRRLAHPRDRGRVVHRADPARLLLRHRRHRRRGPQGQVRVHHRRRPGEGHAQDREGRHRHHPLPHARPVRRQQGLLRPFAGPGPQRRRVAGGEGRQGRGRRPAGPGPPAGAPPSATTVPARSCPTSAPSTRNTPAARSRRTSRCGSPATTSCWATT